MRQSIFWTWQRVILGIALIGTVAAGITGLTVSHERPVAASTVVASRVVLVQGSPEAADGQVLQLVRYHIPFGVVLPMHTHPGMQVAWIESGVLTYTVVSGGSIPVTRKAEGVALPTTELLGPGQTTELHPGDSVVEIDGVVHYGENLGPDPVVILASTLLDPNLPPAVAVTPETPVVATPAA
jgi:quercetin dioxygenase-like cupin family protein